MFWWPWPAVSENSQKSGHRALEILTPEFANSRARQTLKGNWYGFAWQHSSSRNASFLCFHNSVFSILSSNFSGSLGISISVITGVFSSSLSQILRETQCVSGPRRSRKILPTWGCSALSFQSRLSLGSSLSIKHYGMPLTALLLHVGLSMIPTVFSNMWSWGHPLWGPRISSSTGSPITLRPKVHFLKCNLSNLEGPTF